MGIRLSSTSPGPTRNAWVWCSGITKPLRCADGESRVQQYLERFAPAAQIDRFGGSAERQAVGDQRRRIERAPAQHVQHAGLFRRRTGVGADDLALGLEHRIDVERDSRVVRGVGEEDDAPTRPGGLQGEVERGLTAGRVEDGVGAARWPASARDIDDPFGCDGGIGAESPRRLPAVLVRLG